jgi:hypothetical protein
LAADPDLGQLLLKLQDAGIDPGRVVLDYVDPPDQSFLTADATLPGRVW